MTDVTLFAALGFLFAAYAVVGNDALQTLGTFINSNSRLHWGWLFGFAGFVLVATFTYGWVINGGDPSWGRLANSDKYPAVDIQWYHTLPPLVLLVITRFGVPVSTSFMVLTVFATVAGLTSMLQKSLIGYGLAFVVGLVVYLIVTNTLEKHFRRTEISDHAPWGLATGMGVLIGAAIYFLPPLITNGAVSYSLTTALVIVGLGLTIEVSSFLAGKRFGPAAYWTILQWVTTGYLWGVWLIQDFANIFVFLPRELSAVEGFAAMFAILGLLAYTFWNKGGPVQRILQAKTAVTDIRSATVIDFIYASLLFFFKEVSDIPMSTTFVFLGLIAGRELGFAIMEQALSPMRALKLSVSDASKAYIGLVVSINMAVGLPLLARILTEEGLVLSEALPPASFQTFVLIANILLIPISIFLARQESRPRMFTALGLLGVAAASFFIMPPVAV
ncbi:MAG: hypothetical protein AAFS03_09385 [Pseudomonadota bacterium]